MIWFYEAAGAIRDFMELGGNVLWAIMVVLLSLIHISEPTRPSP